MPFPNRPPTTTLTAWSTRSRRSSTDGGPPAPAPAGAVRRRGAATARGHVAGRLGTASPVHPGPEVGDLEKPVAVLPSEVDAPGPGWCQPAAGQHVPDPLLGERNPRVDHGA